MKHVAISGFPPLPKDPEERKKFVESVLASHGFDVSKEYTESYRGFDDQFIYSQEEEKFGNAINHKAYELDKKVSIMIRQWKNKNRWGQPGYLFLSKDAMNLLNVVNFSNYDEGKVTYMGIEVAPVLVPGIYVGIGECFN